MTKQKLKELTLLYINWKMKCAESMKQKNHYLAMYNEANEALAVIKFTENRLSLFTINETAELYKKVRHTIHEANELIKEKKEDGTLIFYV